MFQIEYSKQAMKALLKMPRNTAQLIQRKIEKLAKDPQAMQNVIPLSGRSGFRLRISDWRVIYELENDKLIVFVVKIASRGGSYS